MSKLRSNSKVKRRNLEDPGQKKKHGIKLRKTLPNLRFVNYSEIQLTTKISINPRIERVYIIKGDLNADGKEQQGVVNFFREKVVSFESPSK